MNTHTARDAAVSYFIADTVPYIRLVEVGCKNVSDTRSELHVS